MVLVLDSSRSFVHNVGAFLVIMYVSFRAACGMGGVGWGALGICRGGWREAYVH